MSYWKILTRRKPMPSSSDCSDSKLGRVLDSFDLTALGVGATLGVGVYVLAGHVAKDQAGPSVILSFLIAAAASFLAGLCYAEFGARVPKSGSAYVYSYCTVGEFIAFVIGWNLLLEYSIGSASVAKGISLYIDSIANDSLKTFFSTTMPLGIPGFGEYFDLFSFFVPLLLGIALAFGLKKSTVINNIFTTTNIFVVLFVIIAGSFKADLKNWSVDPKEIPELTKKYRVGEGGFFPFGFEGTLKGAATCFFGFVGFDCIATTGEEVKNPHKAIPRAILLSLLIIFSAYFGVSTVLTLMWPYYLQDPNAPIPHVFQEIGWTAAKWLVSIGGIIGLLSSLFGAMFPLPRIIYAMAQDGLVFRALGNVSERFKTPVTGTLLAGLLTGIFGATFDLQALVNMLSIGTLLAYTVVAISIIMLRFSDVQMDPIIGETAKESSNLLRPGYNVTPKELMRQVFNLNRYKYPNSISMSVVSILVVLYCLSALGLSLMTLYAKDLIYNGDANAITWLVIFIVLTILFAVLMSIQPRECVESEFKVPIVPFLPAISILVNIYLMLMLDIYTWIRFGIWMLIGVPIYFACACFLYKPKKLKTDDKDTETITNNNTTNHVKENQQTLSAITAQNGDIKEDQAVIDNSINVHSERSLESIEVVAEQTQKSSITPIDEVQEDKDNNINQALELLDTVIKAEEDHAEPEKIQNKETVVMTRQSSDQSIISNTVKNHSIVAQVHQELGADEENEKDNNDKIEEEGTTAVKKERANSLKDDNKLEVEFESLEKSSGYHTSDHDTDYHDSLNSLNTITTVSSLEFIAPSKIQDINQEAESEAKSLEFRLAVKSQIDEILAEAATRIEEKRRLERAQPEATQFGTLNKKFLDHLSLLIAQPKHHQNYSMTPQPMTLHHNEKSHVRSTLRHSKSVPDLTIYAEHEDEDKFRNRGESVTSNEIIKIKINEPAIPPPAPKFDVNLYNSLQRKPNLKPLTIPKSNEEEVTFRNKTSDVKKSSTGDSPEQEKNMRLSIKERLEKILSVPPPKRFSLKKVEETPKPKEEEEEVPEIVPNKITSDGYMSDDSLDLPSIKIEKPFDTFRKQRLLFDNVLKSIISDQESSLESNHDETPSNTFKFKLKHVENPNLH